MMARRFRSRRGFAILSLIEFSMATLIGLMLTGGFVLVYQSFMATMGMIRAQGTLRMELTQVMETIRQDANQGTRQMASCVCDGENLQETNGKLVIFAVPAQGPDGELLGPEVGGDTIVYQLDPNTNELRRRVFQSILSSRTEPDQPIAHHLTEFNFEWLDNWSAGGEPPHRLRLALRAQRTEQGRTYEESLVGEVALRNLNRAPP